MEQNFLSTAQAIDKRKKAGVTVSKLDKMIKNGKKSAFFLVRE